MKTAISVFLFAFCVISLKSAVFGFPDGAPCHALTSMEPSHGPNNADVQLRNNPPFALEIGGSYTCNDGASEITVKLKADTGVKFRGFIVQAREDLDDGERIGEFVENSAIYQFQCGVQDSITHISRGEKSEILASWKPRGYSGSVKFLATVVESQNKWYYLNGIRSLEVPSC